MQSHQLTPSGFELEVLPKIVVALFATLFLSIEKVIKYGWHNLFCRLRVLKRYTKFQGKNKKPEK